MTVNSKGSTENCTDAMKYGLRGVTVKKAENAFKTSIVNEWTRAVTRNFWMVRPKKK